MEKKETARMTCPECGLRCQKFGKHRNGLQRFRCPSCGKTYTEEQEKPLGGMTIPMGKAVLAIQLLIEGSSIRSTERITGLHRDTIMRLLVVAGEKCRKLMERKMKNLDIRHIQIDELWAYVQKKQKRVKQGDPDEFGDQYAFVALDPETKLVPVFRVGKRDGWTATRLLLDLSDRLASRVQLTTDAFRPYIEAAEAAFGMDIDYAQLIKIHASKVEEGRERYSPSRVIGTTKSTITGNPDEALVCTSHVERQNLTMRMQIRRLTRLTNAFSKKLDNLKAAVALHFAYYNFCRIHMTLKCTPAMEAGLTDHVWTIRELLTQS